MPEREGGLPSAPESQADEKKVARLTTIWTDGGFDRAPFMQWVMDFCHWIVLVVLRPEQTKGFVVLKKRSCGGTDTRLVDGMSAISQRL